MTLILSDKLLCHYYRPMAKSCNKNLFWWNNKKMGNLFNTICEGL